MQDYSIQDWEAVVLGTGVAGLTLALSLAPKRTLVLTKVAQLAGGSSQWAQGGIAFPANSSDVESHKNDTLEAGAGVSDPLAVAQLIGHGLEAREWLESQGVVFDRTPEGTYALGREGAHSQKRIYHAHGDATGQEMLHALLHAAEAAPHITLRDGVFAWDLELWEGRVLGLWTLDETGQKGFLRSSQIFLAGGGLGQLFGRTTNPPESTGDALAMGLRAGLHLRDMEMIQFHPTGLDLSKEPQRPRQYPLISEAVRGDGAVLVTEDEKPLSIPHPMGSLGPRDVVARSIFSQIQAGERVFLDARQQPGESFPVHFPTVFRLCGDHGLDPRKDLLPVTPVVHYTMGGIPVDLEGRTRIPGLWALGECACTGVHGANRLASNSLLECVVYSRLAAPAALAEMDQVSEGPTPREVPSFRCPQEDIQPYLQNLQDLMFEAAGPLRSKKALEQGLTALDALEAQVRALDWRPSQDFETLKAWREWDNLVTLGRVVLESALANPVSRGAHFRLN